MYIKDNLYKEIVKNTIIQTIDIVFLNENNQILLWLRKNPPLKWLYYLPGWRRYKNEKISDSAIRKSKEELWIDINIEKLIYLWVYDEIYKDSIYKDIWTHCSSLTYVYKLDKIEQSNIKIDSQHSEFKFFEVYDENLQPMIKSRVLDMNKLGIF